MRYLCLLMAALFGLFTYLQFNDLNQYQTELWYGWVLVYAVCAVVSLLSWWAVVPRWLLMAGSLAALVAAVVRSLSIEWEKTVLYNETNPSGNETGGLLVIAVWLAVVAWRHSSPQRNFPKV